jgi:endonuclease/exonuclease/phosphatase family metal-dependent hydrolase
MQWNIHKTKGSDGVCNPDRTASTIARQNVHVVSLNEVDSFSGACAWTFDMGAKLQSLLQQKTGVIWYRQSAHPNSGKGVGNVLLSRYTPVSASSKLLSYGRTVAQMRILVNGRYVNLFSTHVDYYNSSYRYTQITQALSWFSSFSEPRIVMGDFNTWPYTDHYNLLARPYQDAWEGALSAGTAWAFNGNGLTIGGSRFDYVFYSRVAALALRSVKVPDTRVNGVYPSDHYPVIAEYAVR